MYPTVGGNRAAVIYDDLELFLTDWYRRALTNRPEAVCANVSVGRVESVKTPPPAKQLVIRDDGTSRDTFLTGRASIGLTVLAGTKLNPRDAKELAQIVLALAELIPFDDPSNPLTRVYDSNGPYMVPEDSTFARVYSTVTFGVAARPL
ncbi:hypothetical protein ACIPVB_08945 [Microbacterium sp. NPDC090007]|uniref:hypothetical protein n=1 Tax=Microbacterium sp. NPDC090007 TaxID=3364204 RepID=UPI003804B16A